MLDRARVALSPGPEFGVGGEGFARLNLATGPTLLSDAVTRLAGLVECRAALGRSTHGRRRWGSLATTAS